MKVNGIPTRTIRSIDGGRAVEIIDQTLLPNETVYLTLDKAEDLWEAIYSLRVRGAPAIGIFAAYAIYVLLRPSSYLCAVCRYIFWKTRIGNENYDECRSLFGLQSRPTR